METPRFPGASLPSDPPQLGAEAAQPHGRRRRSMTAFFSWESPSSRLVLSGVLELLAEHGYEGLTVAEVRARAGAAGPGLGAAPDLEALVIAPLEEVQLSPAPHPTGQLRRDLRKLLNPGRGAPSPDERAVAAVLSVAVWRPRLKVAV